MPDIIHRVGIACPVEQVFAALVSDQGLSTWWTTDTSGAGDVGSIIEQALCTKASRTIDERKYHQPLPHLDVLHNELS